MDEGSFVPENARNSQAPDLGANLCVIRKETWGVPINGYPENLAYYAKVVEPGGGRFAEGLGVIHPAMTGRVPRVAHGDFCVLRKG